MIRHELRAQVAGRGDLEVLRATVAPDAALQAKVEGPYANGNPPAAVKSGVDPSHQQAEQVVSIVGVTNAQAAYFRGETKLMGKT